MLAALPDEALVRRARAALARGDVAQARACAALLHHRHAVRVRVRVGARVPTQEVDDVEARVWERFVQLVYTGRLEPRSVVAVLLTVVDRCVADHHRARTVDEPASDAVSREPSPDDDLQALLDRDERERLLASLDDRERKVLLDAADGVPAIETAACLGITTGNLYVIAHRARHKLRAARAAQSA